MRLLAVVALAALTVPSVVYGDRADRFAAAQMAVNAAQSLELGNMRVARRAPGGRVRGSVDVAPAGLTFKITVRRGARVVGRRTMTAAAAGRTSFSVRVDRASRARLRRAGHLDVYVKASVSTPNLSGSTGTTARVVR
jgi:hypothetical protein